MCVRGGGEGGGGGEGLGRLPLNKCEHIEISILPTSNSTGQMHYSLYDTTLISTCKM